MIGCSFGRSAGVSIDVMNINRGFMMSVGVSNVVSVNA